MAKTYKSVVQARTQKPGKSLIPERYQDAAYCIGIVLAVLIFLGGAIFGAGFSTASDNLASMSFSNYLKSANESGNFPLWLPYIFSGMPSYAALLTTGDRWWDLTSAIFFGITRIFGDIFSSDTARVAMFYMVYGIGMYFLMRVKKHARFISFFTAFAAVFSTFIITWIAIGHNTKPIALMTMPYIFMCMEKLRERFSVLYSAFLIIAVHILVESTHVQMVFYALCAFGLYLLLEIIGLAFKKESVVPVLRAVGVLAVAGGLAFAMGADRYLSVMEYTPYSTRATAPIMKTPNQQQDANGSFDYEYATNWSFSPEEMATFFVPNYYGYGKLPYAGPETQGETVQVMTYWGQMPFTDAANYMGIGVLAFAIIGAIRFRKNVFVQFLIGLSIFSLFLSFGKNLPILYDFFFYYIPSFNKFRAPSIALVLIQFAVPILAGYGITALVEWRRSGDPVAGKTMRIATILAGAFLALGILYSMAFGEGYISSVAASANGQQLPASLHEFVYDQMISDWFVTALIALGFTLAGWMFVRNKLSQTVFFVALGLLLVFDLWRVGWRGQEVAKQDATETVFRTTDAVQFLQNDNSVYRVADFTGGSPNKPAYFFEQNVHGYHSAKLRVYQDLLDVAGNGGGSMIVNPFLWDLLNVKYLVSDRPLAEGMTPVFQSRESGTLIYANPGQLPRAFFVDSVAVAKPMDILNHLKNGDFDPRSLAFTEQALPQAIEPSGPAATARVTDFRNEYISFDVEATGRNLLVVSEIYYPSWHAYIDGQEVPIHKTNFALRSIIVPPGKHKVEMKFISEKFELGKTLSLIANIIVLGLLAVGIVLDRRKPTPPSDETTETTA